MSAPHIAAAVESLEQAGRHLRAAHNALRPAGWRSAARHRHTLDGVDAGAPDPEHVHGARDQIAKRRGGS